MPMRWRCPPENSCGRRAAASAGRCTISNSAATRRPMSARDTTRCTDNTSARQACTVMRGLSEPSGSWNTIWTWRLYARSPAPLSRRTSLPAKRMSPASGSCRRTRQRARVDLPQPDSPTMPSVSPRATVSETSSTARNRRRGRRRISLHSEPRTAKLLERWATVSRPVMLDGARATGWRRSKRLIGLRAGGSMQARRRCNRTRRSCSGARTDIRRLRGRAGAVGRGC